MTEEIEQRVSAAMTSEAVKESLQKRLVAERKILEEQVKSAGQTCQRHKAMMRALNCQLRIKEVACSYHFSL